MRNSLTDAQKAHYKASYGRDLTEDLKPGHGFTLNIKDMKPGDHGEYSSWLNTGSIGRHTLTNGELFAATLLHETGHFGADMAGFFFEARPIMSAEVFDLVHKTVYSYTNHATKHYFEGDAGYAMEAIGFGRLVTVETH